MTTLSFSYDQRDGLVLKGGIYQSPSGEIDYPEVDRGAYSDKLRLLPRRQGVLRMVTCISVSPRPRPVPIPRTRGSGSHWYRRARTVSRARCSSARTPRPPFPPAARTPPRCRPRRDGATGSRPVRPYCGLPPGSSRRTGRIHSKRRGQPQGK